MEFDVVIVGAGPGGCLAARDFARSGLSVGLFDASAREDISQAIVIEAEKAMFDTVGVRAPQGDDIPYHQKRMRVFSGNGRECFTLEGEHPSMGMYLGRYAQGLCREAEQAGAKFFEGREAQEPIVQEGRVCGVIFKESGSEKEVRARLVIDASGFKAALVRKLPLDMGIGFEDREEDVVIARCHLHECDREKGLSAIARGLHREDEIWSRLGGHGNFSTEYSYMSVDKNRAYILLGRKAVYDRAPLADVVDAFKEEQGYFGEFLYGGSGPIRVRRAWDKLVADGFMVIGEAAGMVIPAHGSGVSSALYAGHLAARVAAPILKAGKDADTAALWPFSYEYQTGRGSILAGYDANKLLIDTLPSDQEARLIEDGAMHSEDLYNGAVPKPISMSLGSLPSRLKGLIKNPGLIPFVIKMGKSISSVNKHWARYPKQWDPEIFADWQEGANKIFDPIKM